MWAVSYILRRSLLLFRFASLSGLFFVEYIRLFFWNRIKYCKVMCCRLCGFRIKYCKVMCCRLCGFRVRVWESYRTSPQVSGTGMKKLQNFQKFRVLWHGPTELTEAPAGSQRCCARTPGIVARSVQNS